MAHAVALVHTGRNRDGKPGTEASMDTLNRSGRRIIGWAMGAVLVALAACATPN